MSRAEMQASEPAPVAADSQFAVELPETLLAPLLDSAAAELASNDPDQLPSVLRPLAGFDRRGLGSGHARQQLRRALQVDSEFRQRVTHRFLARSEVAAALDAWNSNEILARVNEAAERADLALLASALVTGQPSGWQFGLGVVWAVFDRKRVEKERDDDENAHALQLRSADEARSRAEEARDAADAKSTQLEDQLREERRARRELETGAERENVGVSRQYREIEAELARARAAADEAEARLAREAERARESERRFRDFRREVSERLQAREAAETAAASTPAGAQQLAAAIEEAGRLVTTLNELTRRVAGTGVPGAPAARGADTQNVAKAKTTTRRARAQCPPGMRADTADALDAMLRTRGVTLVVDGYNVSMAGWGNVAPVDQRERLIAAVAGLHLRLRCEVVVVFDGADVEGMPPTRRPGVRVVFSQAGEKADPVVIRVAGQLPTSTPAIVVSSDRWVQSQAEEAGATVVPSTALLELLRR